MISDGITPVGITNVGTTGFSNLSLGNTTLNRPLGNGGGFLSGLGGFASSLSGFKDDPLKTVIGFAEKIPVIGDVVSAVAGIADFIGGIFGGVDFEKDVKPKIINRTKNRINHATSYYLGDSNLDPALRLTKADAYLSWTIHWIRIDRNKRLKSEAWKKGYDMWVKMLEEWLNQLRISVSQEFDVSVQTKDLRQYSIINHLNEPAKFPHGSNIPHGVYTKKLQSQQATKVGARGNIIPTTSPQGKTNNNMPLIAIGVAFLFKKQIAKLLGIRL